MQGQTIVFLVAWFSVYLFGIPWLDFYLHPDASTGHVIGASLAGFAFALLFVVTAAKYHTPFRLAFHTGHKTDLSFPIMTIVSLAFLSIILCYSGGRDSHLQSPGIIFVVTLGAVTALGFVITICKLDEIHGRILDYPHLIERCKELADRELDRVENRKKKGKIIIFANAPGFGNASAPREFEQFAFVLNPLLSRKEVAVKIACLSWIPNVEGKIPHRKFYESHWGKSPDIGELITQSEEVLNEAGESHGRKDKKLYRLRDEVIEVPFHLFLTSDRAILFITLNFPPAEDGNRKPSFGDNPVNIVGFETGDRSILQELELAFTKRIKYMAIEEKRTPFQIQRNEQENQ